MIAAAETQLDFTVDEIDLIASICRESFYEFVKRFWDTVIAEDFVDNWHIEYLCDVLQDAAELVFEGKPKTEDIIVNIPPGTTKSTITSVMYPAWIWTRMTSARIIAGSHTQDLTHDLSRRCREVIKSEKYQLCFPNVSMEDNQDAKGYFVNTEGGFRLSVTVGGKTPTGFHAHFLIIDDPIDPQEAESEAKLKAANKFMKDTLPSRKVDKKLSVTILIMQRLHQNDPSGNWLERNKNKPGTLKHICLPAELSDNVQPPRLRSKYVDDLLDPVRLPRTVLEEYKLLGSYSYAGQFMQTPIPLGGGMFKVEQFRYGIPEPLRHFKRLVRYWDKAGTMDGGAWTVGLKLGVSSDNRLWVLDIIRGQWSSEIREKYIKEAARADGVRCKIGIEQEPGSGGKESAENTVRNLRGYVVKVDRPQGEKAIRADPISVQVNLGLVWLVKDAPWIEAFLAELRFFPYSTYKDQGDAFSGAFAMVAKPKVLAGGF